MKKLLLAAALGICIQPVFAEGQISAKVVAVLTGNLGNVSGVVPSLSATEQAFIMDTADPNYTDWNDPGEEFTTQCAAYPIGNIVIIDTATDTGKLAMSTLVSARLAELPVIVIYSVTSDAGFQTGFKCSADLIIM